MPLDTPRDLLRSALLGTAAPFQSKPLTLDTPTGQFAIVIREPTFKQRNEIYAACTKTPPPTAKGAPAAPPTVDFGRLQFLALAHLIHTPDGARVFDAADLDVIEALPASHPLIAVALPVAMEMLGAKKDEEGNGKSVPASSAA